MQNRSDWIPWECWLRWAQRLVSASTTSPVSHYFAETASDSLAIRPSRIGGLLGARQPSVEADRPASLGSPVGFPLLVCGRLNADSFFPCIWEGFGDWIPRGRWSPAASNRYSRSPLPPFSWASRWDGFKLPESH